MNITKNIIGALLAISILTVSAMAVSASSHEEVKQAVADGDYDTFIELTQDRPNAQEITQDDFAKIQEAHTLAESGDREGARAIFDELGLKPHKGQKSEKRQEFRQAIEDGDYDTWAARVTDRGGEPTEANFAVIQQAHELHQAGDHEAAKELLEANGIERPQGKRGEHRGGDCKGPQGEPQE